MAGQCIQLIKPVEIDCKDKNKSKVHIMNKNGLYIIPHNEHYVIKVLLQYYGDKTKRIKVANNIIKTLSNVFNISVHRDINIIKRDMFNNDYTLIFKTRDLSPVSVDNNDIATFEYIDLSTYGGRGILTKNVYEFLKVQSDIKTFIDIVETVINLELEVSKLDIEFEINTICKKFDKPTQEQLEKKHDSKDNNVMGDDFSDFCHQWRSEVYNKLPNDSVPQQTELTNKLILPKKMENDKNNRDDSRSGCWERIKSTFVKDIPKITLDDIGGYKEVKEEMVELIHIMKNSYVYEQLGLRQPRGLIFHGSPGTGKTLFAKALAFEANVKVFLVEVSDISSKWIGEHETLTKMIFEFARLNKPCIVIIDEIEAFLPDRGSVREDFQRVVSIFLSNMDGFNNTDNILFFGTTNYPELIDKAILRSGRFNLIKIPLPDKDARKEIFKIHCRNKKVKGINYELLAQLSEGFSGADIEESIMDSLRKKIRIWRKQNRDLESICLTMDDITTAVMNFDRGSNRHPAKSESISYI